MAATPYKPLTLLSPTFTTSGTGTLSQALPFQCRVKLCLELLSRNQPTAQRSLSLPKNGERSKCTNCTAPSHLNCNSISIYLLDEETMHDRNSYELFDFVLFICFLYFQYLSKFLTDC